MKLKIIFGIALPVLVIFSLAILGGSTTGFSLEKSFTKKISLEDTFYNDQLRNTIVLGNITLENDYFLGKRHTLKPLLACLIDNDHVKDKLYAGNVFYSEGDYDSISKTLFGYDSYAREQSVEISSRGTKIVYVYLTPSYGYYQNYSDLLVQYREYDELVLIEQEDSRESHSSYQPRDCYNVQEAEIIGGIHMPLQLS